MGFVYNGETSNGVDQFRTSVDDIQDNINSAYTMVRMSNNVIVNRSFTVWLVSCNIPSLAIANNPKCYATMFIPLEFCWDFFLTIVMIVVVPFSQERTPFFHCLIISPYNNTHY